MEATAEKIALRAQMRDQLAALTDETVRAASASVWEELAGVPEAARAKLLLVYVSKDNEVRTHGLIEQMLAMGKRLCVPKFDDDRQEYIASEIRDFRSELTEGRFKILEPKPASARPVAVDALEALVVPGLAFDEKGNRLGRGMGYFDRILSQAKGPVIGLAYDFQVLKHVPVEAHDAVVDIIVTETRVIEVKRKSQ